MQMEDYPAVSKYNHLSINETENTSKSSVYQNICWTTYAIHTTSHDIIGIVCNPMQIALAELKNLIKV